MLTIASLAHTRAVIWLSAALSLKAGSLSLSRWKWNEPERSSGED
jgi:hypothetical protein